MWSILLKLQAVKQRVHPVYARVYERLRVSVRIYCMQMTNAAAVVPLLPGRRNRSHYGSRPSVCLVFSVSG